MTAPQVLIPLAPGFEEIEAVTIKDVLTRAGATCVLAGLESGPIAGAHGVRILPDTGIGDVNADDYAMIVLPGGLPGAENLRDDDRVIELLKAMAAKGRFVAAICAAPIALGRSGVVAGKSFTCYPGFESQVEGGNHVARRVVVDGKLITSRGPGTALEFALTLTHFLMGSDAAAQLEEGMLVSRPEEPFIRTS